MVNYNAHPQEDACLLLRRAEDDGLFKSKKDPRGKAMCAAVTYITCRTWGVSRTMKDLSKAVDLSLRDVNKACKVRVAGPAYSLGLIVSVLFSCSAGGPAFVVGLVLCRTPNPSVCMLYKTVRALHSPLVGDNNNCVQLGTVRFYITVI